MTPLGHVLLINRRLTHGVARFDTNSVEPVEQLLRRAGVKACKFLGAKADVATGFFVEVDRPVIVARQLVCLGQVGVEHLDEAGQAGVAFINQVGDLVIDEGTIQPQTGRFHLNGWKYCLALDLIRNGQALLEDLGLHAVKGFPGDLDILHRILHVLIGQVSVHPILLLQGLIEFDA